jgi:hypothetical protein
MRIGTVLVFNVLGFLIGSTAGEIAGMLVPEALRTSFIFTPSIYPGFEPVVYNLDVLQLTFGLYVKVNFFSLACMGLTALVLLICELSGAGRGSPTPA